MKQVFDFFIGCPIQYIGQILDSKGWEFVNLHHDYRCCWYNADENISVIYAVEYCFEVCSEIAHSYFTHSGKFQDKPIYEILKKMPRWNSETTKKEL